MATYSFSFGFFSINRNVTANDESGCHNFTGDGMNRNNTQKFSTLPATTFNGSATL